MTNEDRAFLLSPLAMPFACVLAYSGFSFSEGILHYLLWVGIIGLFGLPVVYVIEFFLGYRFYRLLLKKKMLNAVSITFGCMMLSNIPTLFIAIFSSFVPSKHNMVDILGLFSFIGFVVGLTFWAMLRWDVVKKLVGKGS
jgi:hypothetical protein